MKLLNTFFLLFSLAIVNNCYAQSEPDKKTTLEYISKVFEETKDYEFIREEVVYKIQPRFQTKLHNFEENWLVFSFRAPDNCEFEFQYNNIDWAKMQSIKNSNDSLASYSPVKFLNITFTPNSILRHGYSDNCNLEGFTRRGENTLVSQILFPYRDEEGVEERLIKALNHLSKLAKEEKAKNDPFGN